MEQNNNATYKKSTVGVPCRTYFCSGTPCFCMKNHQIFSWSSYSSIAVIFWFSYCFVLSDKNAQWSLKSTLCDVLFVVKVKEKIVSGEFKPNCAIVILDFLIRHGVIQADTGEYVETGIKCDGVTCLPWCTQWALYIYWSKNLSHSAYEKSDANMADMTSNHSSQCVQYWTPIAIKVVNSINTIFPAYYIHDKITAIWLVKGSAIISLIIFVMADQNNKNPIWRRNVSCINNKSGRI